MNLKELLNSIKPVRVLGNTDREIAKIEFDSRKIGSGDLFVATTGSAVDGHQFIGKAMEAGATAVVCQVLPEKVADNICFVQVADSAESLGFLAAQ